jgi:uncharacterized BrkB/YihY/UPF0761 family membrane protein
MDAKRVAYRKSVTANIRALVIGVVVATVLVTGYTLIEVTIAQRLAGHPFLVPPESQALMALLYSPMVAVVLAACCAPVWLLLQKVRLDAWYAAGALGFLAVMTFWVLSNIEAGSVLELIRSGLVYAVCGALAGLATWWVSSRA